MGVRPSSSVHAACAVRDALTKVLDRVEPPEGRLDCAQPGLRMRRQVICVCARLLEDTIVGLYARD